MWRLVKFLEENEQEIVGSAGMLSRDRTNGMLSGTADTLNEIWPDANEWALELGTAALLSVWLGRVAQKKKESSGSDETARFFKEVLHQAFEVGKRSAITRP